MIYNIKKNHIPAVQNLFMQAPIPQMSYQQPQAMVMNYPETNATAALVLSIIAIVTSFIYGIGILFAIPGLILANGALNIANQFPNHPDVGMAKAAKICSWVAIGIFIFVILLVVLAGVLYVWAASLQA